MARVNPPASIRIGEGFAGEGAHVAHVNTVLGRRDGPVGTAWATAWATPRAGHIPFVCVVRPNLPVQPMTLFVNKAAIDSDRHGNLTWGAAQAGVAGGVVDWAVDAVALDVSDLALIAAVWVDPAATDEELVYANNRAATAAALRNGARNEPSLDAVIAEARNPWNPYFRPGSGTRG